MDNKLQPTLTVVGGCNGSGKSSFSKALSIGSSIPFDYDKVFLKIYKSLPDSDLRDRMAHKKSREILENRIAEAIAGKSDFCYETNFNSTPLYWPEHFKRTGYRLVMIYFCLDSIDEAKRRVQIRVENGGHFVPEWEIKSRYNEGFSNLNGNWKFFDEIHLFDSSYFGKPPSYLLSIVDGEVVNFKNFPPYLKPLLSDLPTKQE